MAISVISVSSDSSEESVGASTGRVILFGTIPTTIPDTTPFVIPPSTHIDITLTPTSPDYTPTSPDYTLASPNYSPASNTEFDSSKDLDTPETPPSPTHGTPFTKMTQQFHYSTSPSRHDSCTQAAYSSWSTVPLPFSCAETSLDPSLDDLSNSSYGHSLPAPSSGMRPSHHLCSLVPSIPYSSAAISDRPSHDYSSESPSRKRSRSLAASVLISSTISGALSYARADLLPSPKRIRSPESTTDLEVSLAEGFEPSRYKGTELKMDDDVVRSDGIDIDPEIQAYINECIAYADALRVIGIDARVVVEAVDREEIEMGARCLVEVRVDRVTHPVIADDIPKPTQEEGAVEVTYETLGDLVQRFYDHTEEILVCHVQAIKSVQRDQGYMIIATGQQSVVLGLKAS
ncbi:hypothetical protein Tco_1427062, partial [Tanacetum coccineum]